MPDARLRRLLRPELRRRAWQDICCLLVLVVLLLCLLV
jgi:hypothetical protein